MDTNEYSIILVTQESGWFVFSLFFPPGVCFHIDGTIAMQKKHIYTIGIFVQQNEISNGGSTQPNFHWNHLRSRSPCWRLHEQCTQCTPYFKCWPHNAKIKFFSFRVVLCAIYYFEILWHTFCVCPSSSVQLYVIHVIRTESSTLNWLFFHAVSQKSKIKIGPPRTENR